MKTLIIDDEKHVRSSIRRLVDWEAFGIETVLEADNGLNAIEVIQREQPEIVIMDMMMPFMNGTELMEWVVVHAPYCKKIVVSGHSDFEFMRHTIKHGGIDYLLKPIDQKQLREAVRKAVESLMEVKEEQRKAQEQSTKSSEMELVYHEKLLSRLLEPPNDNVDKLAPFFRNFTEATEMKYCRLAVFNLDILGHHVRVQSANNNEALISSILSICNDYLRPVRQGVAFQNWNTRGEIAMLFWDGLGNVEEIISRIDTSINQTLNTSFHVGISQVMPFPLQLYKAYKQAVSALKERNLLDRLTRIHPFHTDVSYSVSALGFGEYAESIRISMNNGKTQQIEATIQSWFDYIITLESITLSQLERWWKEFDAFKIRWIEQHPNHLRDLEASQDNIPLISPLDEQGVISLSLFRQEITQDLISLSCIFAPKDNQRHQPMQEIARYIQANYASEITLGVLSNKFFLNPEYISRRFKQHFEQNVFDFINVTRIENAKILLMNPQYKIAEVALMVGYQDEKYFSRVFKKLEQITPKDFRKTSNDLRN